MRFSSHRVIPSLAVANPSKTAPAVLSRMVDAVMIRTFDHTDVELFAQYSSAVKWILDGMEWTDRI